MIAEPVVTMLELGFSVFEMGLENNHRASQRGGDEEKNIWVSKIVPCHVISFDSVREKTLIC